MQSVAPSVSPAKVRAIHLPPPVTTGEKVYFNAALSASASRLHERPMKMSSNGTGRS